MALVFQCGRASNATLRHAVILSLPHLFLLTLKIFNRYAARLMSVIVAFW